jgi:hypothetical protein
MYRVILVKDNGEYKRDVKVSDREAAITLAEHYNSTPAGKYDAVYVYDGDNLIWLDSHAYALGDMWYAAVSVEDDGRKFAISKHSNVNNAILTAAEWFSDKDRHTQVLRNPGGTVVWDSKYQIS